MKYHVLMNLINRKTLLILEDLYYKHMSKEQKHRWNRMYGAWSTHNHISAWSTFQTPFSSPPEMRQMCSFIILWRIPDYNCMTILSSRFGINSKTLKFIFENYIKDIHDFIIIDSLSLHLLYALLPTMQIK